MEKSLSPKLAAVLDNGMALHRAGDLNAALEAYNKVLNKQPRQPDALSFKGVALMGLGDAEGAVKFLGLAAKRRPEDAIILNDLGMAQEALGDADSAYQTFQKAYALDPALPAALVNMARYGLAAGQADEALAQAEQAIKTQPGFVQAYNVRGLALQALERKDEALVAYAAALAQSPNDADALFNKGEVLRQMGNQDGALTALERATQAAAQGSRVWVKAAMTIGLIQAGQGDHEAAMRLYNGVLEQAPSDVPTLINRGELKQKLGNISGAGADFSAALDANSESSIARFNQACGCLLSGDWAAGWDAHEARWLIGDPSLYSRARGIDDWDGALTDGMKLLVWGEQGLGDQVLFSSLLRDFVGTGMNLTVEVDQRMVPLLRRSFPDLNVVPYDSLQPDELLSFDAQIAMGSLGRFLRRSPEAFPEAQTYLSADTEQTRKLRQKYLDAAAGRKVVGIAWNSVNPSSGIAKSLPLDQWGSILMPEDALYVSLQYGDVTDDVSAASTATGVDILVDEEIDPIADFDGAAAQIAAMDLIISTSNTAVHVAGALGVPTYVMVPIVPNWRWGFEGQTAPWYPNLRLFRQTSFGEWESVIAEVSDAFAIWRREA